ncbi:hypothetical protein ACAW74_12515 [Fibrella sp. WM1]|uniref:hypothetical protein n=1 Tax=Fibrella musci TaxID=3242485 RepID=UPI003522E0AE
MNARPLLLSTALLLSLIFGCKKSSDPAANTSCTQANVTEKANAYSAAVQAYVTAQTNANCKAVVAAYDNYLAVAQNCSFVTQASVTAIQQARADLAKNCQ